MSNKKTSIKKVNSALREGLVMVPEVIQEAPGIQVSTNSPS